MTSNAQLMKQARETLSGKWGVAVAATLIYFVISSAVSSIPFASLLVSGPLSLGFAIFFLALARGKKPNLSQLFEGFNKFVESLVAFLLMALFTFLWSLLLIIPGIIAAISYSQTYFIIAEEKIDGWEAMRKSTQMMKGLKWKYFKLCLRFFGWFLLSILTLGIGFLFLVPYAQASFANFYDDIK